ncbi:MAG: NTP transferase domain-containing protein [Patescibacteria group bacterium]|nr:NTP transferase domain-containing protein [Patescibacteria group bacterium]
MNKIGAIILAAGKGKRMNSRTSNKVALPLHGRPIISYAVDLLIRLKIKPIIIVVGFAKRSVIDALKLKDVVFAEQKKRLGTGHAALCGFKKLPKDIQNVIIFYGDDSFFYKEDVVNKLINAHLNSKTSITLLTIEKSNPFGLGRVVRDKKEKVIKIVEEKDATEEEKKITEINPALYIFKAEFLRKYLKKIQKGKISKEYYLTDLVDIAIQNRERIKVVKAGNIPWRGINTKEELEEAKRLLTLSH